jgi:hypothetical protein
LATAPASSPAICGCSCGASTSAEPTMTIKIARSRRGGGEVPRDRIGIGRVAPGRPEGRTAAGAGEASPACPPVAREQAVGGATLSHGLRPGRQAVGPATGSRLVGLQQYQDDQSAQDRAPHP